MTVTLTRSRVPPDRDPRDHRRRRRRRLPRRWSTCATASTARSPDTTTTPSPPPSCSPTTSPTTTSCGLCGSSSVDGRSSAASASTFRSRRARRSPSGSSSCSAMSGVGASASAALRARRADRARARPHRAAVVGGASRRPGPAHRRRPPASARSPRTTPRGSSRNGYALEQVERNSALDLAGSFDDVEQLLAEARAAATGYRVVQWFAPTPPEFVDGYAWMKSRMSTDAPAAALEFDEETWDAARIARHDSQVHRRRAALMLVTAAQHIETGELCAFNELVDRHGPHRGHPIRRTRSC